MQKTSPKIALLVPFSSEDPSRIEIWRHVKHWLETTLDYPLYIGEHFPDKPIHYNLSLARNLAAQKAGDWDVAIIHDADTVISPEQIKRGVAAALETGAVTYPYTERWELDFEGTKMLLTDESSNWQSHMTPYTRNQPLGGCIIVRRDLWELVRGFDTGFVGWGHEDGAFAAACQVLSGKKLQRVKGRSLHLEHVAAQAKKADNPVYLANKARVKRYLEAANLPDAQELIRNLRDESIKTDKKAGINWPKSTGTKSIMNYSAALMLLVDVTNVLDKYNCTHWLSDGTLLSAIRDGNFMAQDDDLDLGVWAPDFDIRVIHELLQKFSCTLPRLHGKPEDGMLISIGRAGIHLDMFFYYPYKRSGKQIADNSIYSSFYALEKPYNTSNKAKRYDFVYPHYKSLVRYRFLGHEFWVPENAKEYLLAEYGPEWVIDKTGWDTVKDQCNLVPHGIVDDMAANTQTVMQYLKIQQG